MPSMRLVLWPGVALVLTTLAALVLRGITLTVLAWTARSESAIT
jgi:hypothetical protein